MRKSHASKIQQHIDTIRAKLFLAMIDRFFNLAMPLSRKTK
jgi:hypothetical protein